MVGRAKCNNAYKHDLQTAKNPIALVIMIHTQFSTLSGTGPESW